MSLQLPPKPIGVAKNSWAWAQEFVLGVSIDILLANHIRSIFTVFGNPEPSLGIAILAQTPMLGHTFSSPLATLQRFPHSTLVK
jgi:hypothetical protein